MSRIARAKQIFNDALELPQPERAAFVERECAGDSVLRAEVEALLAVLSGGEAFLSAPTACDTTPTADHDPHVSRTQGTESASDRARRIEAAAEAERERPGNWIGPYKILEQIGEGGFGSVFMAEQEKPVARRVALKIIKLGMDTRQVIARFEAERQALALMDHPNIARVLDAGATETGRPYFVMELVKGQPITTFCDHGKLSIPDRLELFAQVCTAVQHAHTKGVIHRDIKPSNVLVSVQDGKPFAKVIDFGIAKATASKLTDKTLFTQHQQIIGTPEYMSPEQAHGSLDIDTRTDVYSLGVLLYELLTGATPFTGTELRSAAYDEIRRIIREVDPPAPSTRLSRDRGTLASVAALRRMEPKKLGMAVRGELDWIVMKALEKDRARRYETASGLSMDIRRYLSGEAVVAAPPSASYRLRKFVGRHRGPVLAASLVAAALVLGIVGTTLGLIDADRQRRRAEDATAAEAQQRRLAQERLAESEATVRFLDDMLGAVDPTVRGKDVTVRSVLDQASGQVGAEYADNPLVEARLHATMGRTYLGLGENEPAAMHVKRAMEIRRRELGDSHEDTCRAVNAMGSVLVRNGSHAEAEALLKKAIEDHTRLFGRTHEITLESMSTLAMLYESQVRPVEAAVLVREVLEARVKALGPEHRDTLEAKNTLALIDMDLRRFEESDALFRQVIEVQDRVMGQENPHTLTTKANYALMLYQDAMEHTERDPEGAASRLERSRVLGEQVLEARTRVLGDEHQDTLSSLGNLGLVYKTLRQYDKADALAAREIGVSIRVLGEDHPDTIVSIANYGNSLRNRGRCEEALPYLERAVAASRRALPPDSPGMAFALGWYGSCLRDLRRFAEAESPLIEGRTIALKSLGENHPATREMARGLFMLYDEWDRAEPGKGYAPRAAEWKQKIDSAPAVPPPEKK